MSPPEAPTANESTTTGPTDDGAHETGAQPSRTVVSTWEEPHPGVPIRMDGYVAGGNHSGGGIRGGMAAKGYGPYARGKPSVARRRSRHRVRSVVVKPLEIPTHVQEEPKIRSAPLPTSPMLTLGETLVLTPLGFERSAALGGGWGSEAGSEATTMRTSTEDLVMAERDKAALSPVPSLSFTDFSNFTGAAADHEDRRSVFDPLTVFGSEDYGDACVPEGGDLYGWNAEFERTLQQEYTVGSCDVRRSSAFGRGLMERVLSFGGPHREIHFTE